MSTPIRRIQVVDSHTAGEPTRVVIAGGPDLGDGPLTDQRLRFQTEYDDFRSAVILEPRGSDVLVGALLCQPTEPESAAAVLFFNNSGLLKMCGHGTIGLMVTLAHMGRISPGRHRIETVAGPVTATLLDQHRVAVQNVPAYRYRKDVSVDIDGQRTVRGDIAWGGNWFFLVDQHGQQLHLERWKQLTDFTLRIRRALKQQGITGAHGEEIDHIELFGPAASPEAHSRNFVLCPGGAYDRSPCGTGTSAKLACLYADGKLQPGQIWRQESIVGTVFEATMEPLPASAGPEHEFPSILPTITGSAWVTAEASLIQHPADPFRAGIVRS